MPIPGGLRRVIWTSSRVLAIHPSDQDNFFRSFDKPHRFNPGTTRFSADKTPYKTQFSMFFWEGDAKRIENPGFYMCFDHRTLTLAGGAHEFPSDKLEQFRAAVLAEESGEELAELTRKLPEIQFAVPDRPR